ncbi:ferritin-like fold-containing protein [Gryllotalpicola ginsengisoli]|uniref:ferritin-like fold-containing protein n=1 Tax=Gryllotalpicola ginsengisoli TaxID=444608 RepID=UPI0003B3929F|nr:ferritin-like fold-containing protein [Gryllotalpicola ginsengisoli]
MAFAWFRRRRRTADAPTLRPRRERRRPGPRVDVAEIAPEPLSFLGHIACVKLHAFQTLSALVAEVPDWSAREAVSAAAGRELERHQRVVAEIRRRDADPGECMQPFAPLVARFGEATRGADWLERLLGARIAGGLFDDFFATLAPGVRDDGSRVLAALVEADPHEGDALDAVLLDQIAADPQLGSRLALWGRRLVGDVLLVARAGIKLTGDPETDEYRTEPILTEVIAAHTRRMDKLGLTA